MELRGRDEEILMPSTSSYNLSRKVSSTKLSSSTVASTVGERRDQTVHVNSILSPTHALDHHQLHHHHHQQQHHPQQSNPHPVENTDKPRTDPEPNPDPVPISIAGSGATDTPITGASTIKALRPQPQTITSTTRAAPKVRYRECLKNHAASMGGHVMDGCGEFMSSGEEGTPEALKCAACDCHRNFHRKEVEGGSQYVSNYHYASPSTNHVQGEVIPPHLHHQHHKFPHVLSSTPPAGNIAPIMVSFGRGGGAPAESSSEDLNMFRPNVGVQTSAQAQQSKKRFRTRFTGDQKDKMMEFAEKLGWKIQKHDEQDVQQFCSEVGVTKQVFKVWMHNNKQAMRKKQM